MSADVPPAAPEVDYSRKWLVMIAIGMGIFLGTIDGSIVNAALPTLVEDLDSPFAAVQWVVLGYLLTLATLTLGVGRIGDMVGKRPIYTAGFGLFTVASMLCGLAPTVGWLIAARIVQGAGAAMIFALGFAILTEAFPPGERGRALGVAGSLVSIGVAVGPALGGLIIDALSWHWIFFVNLPIGIIGTWTAYRFVPDVSPPGGQRFDFAGAGVFFVALLSIMLSLTLGQERGFGDGLVLGLLALGAVAGAVFIVVERRVDQPMLDLAIFSDNTLSINLITGWLSFVGLVGVLFLSPFYLQDVLGYDTRTMGLLLAVAPIFLGLTAPLSGNLSDRLGTRPILIVGLAILLGAYLALTTLSTETTALTWTLLMMPVGVGLGVFQSPNNSAVMGSVPPHRLGVTSGMLTITRITGQITGIAVMGALWAGRVAARSGLTDPTLADPSAQVGGLIDVVWVVVVLSAVALALSVWALFDARRRGSDDLGAVMGRPSLHPEAPPQ